MRTGLRGGVTFAIVTVSAVILISLVLSVKLVVEPNIEQQILEQLRDTLSSLDQEAMRDRPDTTITNAANRIGAWLLLLNEDDQLIASSQNSSISQVFPSGVPWARNQISTSTSWSGRALPESSREEHLVVALSTDSGATVVAMRPVYHLNEILKGVQQLVVIIALPLLALALVLGWVFSRQVLAPVHEVSVAAARIADGELKTRVPANVSGELGRLSQSFNRMAENLEKQFRRVSKQKGRLQTVLDSMVEFVFVTNAEGRIRVSNAKFDEILGASLLGQRPRDVIDSEELHEAVRRARKGKATSVEVDLELGGDRRLLKAEVAPLPGGLGVVAVLHDVTELTNADRVRRDFVANASHELRTPLTAIRGFAETLRDGALDDRDRAERFLHTILRHTSRLQELVSDLSILSRSETPTQEFHLRPIDLQELVQFVTDGLDTEARTQKVELLIDDSKNLPLVRGSRRALEQILINLIENGLKYTPEGGVVRVNFGEQEDTVYVEVEDNGPGVPAQHLGRVFERFYRIDHGRAREAGGSGLGLAIVKHLANRIHADVTVSSEEGQGACFRVLLEKASEDDPIEESSIDSPATDVGESQIPSSESFEDLLEGEDEQDPLPAEEKDSRNDAFL